MILKTGVDLIETQRVRDAIERHGNRFLNRIFTPQELTDCDGNYKSLAARFAAKEAVSKLFGTGIGVVRFKEIEIIRKGSGAPELRLYGSAVNLADEIGLSTWSISLSHTDEYAIAMVVAGGN